MIVDSMTHEEVYQELARDLPNLSRKMERSFKDNRRYALKQDSKKFPIPMVGHYTSPRRIKYGLIVILQRRSEKDFLHFAYTIRHTPNGNEVYICRTHDESTLAKMIFIPHALKRYAERSGNEHTGEDLVRSMLIRSYGHSMSSNQLIGAKSVRYKGDMLLTLCTREGAWLGKKEGDIYVVNTFISNDMMGGLQKEILTPHIKAAERGRDAVDDLIFAFNNRSTLKSNQPIKKRNYESKTNYHNHNQEQI